MKKDDIILLKAVDHILDGAAGFPVLSDTELELNPDFCDFVKAHLEKVTEGDETKTCEFTEESQMGQYLKTEFSPEGFVDGSRRIANHLYGFLNANPDIPSADLLVSLFRHGGEEYLGILKMNYKSSYTHLTRSEEDGAHANMIIRQEALLPSAGQKLQEAAVISLSDFSIRLAERKYEVNGEKVNYLSRLVLECRGPMSTKHQLRAVEKAVQQIDRKYYPEEDLERKMQVKQVLCQELEERGGIQVEAVKEKLYSSNEEMRREFEETMEEHHLQEAVIAPQNPSTVARIQRQVLTTDTGIELKIPTAQLGENGNVEFITQPDGHITVVIKNISALNGR